MQEVLSRLGREQEAKSEETQRRPRQQRSTVPQQKIHLLVTKRDARIKELEEEIQQISFKGKKQDKMAETTLTAVIFLYFDFTTVGFIEKGFKGQVECAYSAVSDGGHGGAIQPQDGNLQFRIHP